MKRNLWMLMLIGSLLSCQPEVEKDPIVATNRWTAAYIEAATGEVCPQLAPSDMAHPPEYELTPGDFIKIAQVDYLFYAGYEKMMSEIAESAELTEDQLLVIDTAYSRENLIRNLNSLGDLLGTREISDENLEILLQKIDSMDETWGGEDRKVAVHLFQQSLARDMGWDIVEVFGPAPLEAADIDRLVQSDVEIIIDNLHNPIGEILEELMPQSSYIQWMNFPGTLETQSLADVLDYNQSRLEEVLEN